MSTYRLIILGMSFTAFLWGTSFYPIKNLLKVMSYQVLTFNRFWIATLALGLWWVIIGKREKIKKADWLRLCIGGLLGGTVYYALSNAATSALPAMDLSIVSGMQPVLMMIVECVVIGTLFNERESISIALSVVGSIMLIDTISTSQDARLYMVQVCATVVWVIYYLVQKPLVLKYRATTIIFFQFLICTLFAIPIVATDPTLWVPLDFSLSMQLMYLGVGGLAVAYSLNSFALKQLSPTAISLFLNAGPIINILLGWILFGQSIRSNQVMGAILIVLGVVLILRAWRIKNKIPH